MKKDEYILRSIGKLPHKRWELFIITKIVHSILENECDIEFSCQQLVRRPDGGFGLTDIYFPQLKLHLEIDELHHRNPFNMMADLRRQKDIIDATGHRIERMKVYHEGNVPAYKNLSEVILEVDNFILKIIEKRMFLIDRGEWEPWDFDKTFDPEKYIRIGYLDLADSPAFRTHRDTLRCFGYTGGHYQKAVWTIGDIPNKIVWFPKLYPNGDWKNSISDDGLEIHEVPLSPATIGKFGELSSRSIGETRVVFAHYKDSLGITLYRYLGEFIASESKSSGSNVVYDRIDTRTFLPPQ